jgi:hypothetical protein
MYHYYAIQVHGYVTQTGNRDGYPFILVHGLVLLQNQEKRTKI